jgi:lysophospholipase L1-like esterase
VLIGASIARGWQLDGFAARTGRSDVAVEYVGEYGFDKSKSVAALLARGAAERPDLVILKECGAYFPGDQSAYEAMIRRWVAELRAAGIRPAVATVAPVAAPSGVIQHLKEFVKAWVLGREEQNAAIARYNAWIRAYAAAESLPLLDLERALLQPDSGSYALSPRHDSGDGLHLNPSAYLLLDQELDRLLDRQGP